MKTNLLKLAAFVAMALGALISCNKESLEPVSFPESIGTITVMPGDDPYEFSFKAPVAWTVSLETDNGGTDWFWLERGSQPSLELSGEASENVSVKVYVSSTVEYEKSRSCKVYITMNGEKKLYATITRPEIEILFEMYLAKSDSNGFTEGYKDTPVDRAGEPLEFIWDKNNGSWRLSFLVKHTVSWELSDVPEWLTIYGLNKVKPIDETEFSMQADLSKMPMTETKFSLKVTCSYGEDLTYSFVLPSSENLRISSLGNTVSFNADGTIGDMEQTLMRFTITSVEALNLYPVAKIGEWYYVANDPYSDFNWLTLNEMDGWDDNGGRIQDLTYTLSMSANDSEDGREAYLLAIPASIEIENPSFDLFNDEGTEILEKYEQYIISTVTQEGTGGAFVTFDTMNRDGVAVARAMDPKGTVPNESDMYVSLREMTPNLYTLVFSDKDNAFVRLEKLGDYDNLKYHSISSLDTEIEASKLFAKGEDMGGNFFLSTNADNCTDDAEPMLIVFYKGGMPAGIIYCSYIAGYSETASGAPFSFAYPDYVSGAVLTPVKENDIIKYIQSETSISNTANIWQLTYTTKSPMMAMVNVPFLPVQWPWNDPDTGAYWLSYEAMNQTQILVSMEKEYEMDFFVFRNSPMDPVEYVLVCTYAPEE